MKTTDGVNIAYYTAGSGEPLLVTNAFGAGHLTLERRVTMLAEWYSHITDHRTLVRWDARNIGMSDRRVEDVSPEAIDFDIEAVMGALGLSSADLLAGGPGSLHALGFAGRHPDAVRKLVLIGPVLRFADYYRGPQGAAILALAETDWNLFVETASHARIGWTHQESQEFAELWRESMSQEDFLRTIHQILEFDASPVMSNVRAETLVLYSSTGMWARASARTARLIASEVPGAKVMQYDDTPQTWLLSSTAMRIVDEFLGVAAASEPATASVPSGTAIILFADIVDSTALTERLGDAAFRDKARELDASMRAIIRDHTGTAIEGKLLGDGVLAVFTSARQAIEAARACAGAGDSAGLPLHLGIHAGDVIREDNNVYGGAVNIAARISALSAPGEVLVSDTVRSLARTSAGVTFADRGEQSLKGIEEPVRVWAVEA